MEAVAAACLKKHGSLQGLRAAQAKNKAKAAKAAATKRGESKDPVVKVRLCVLTWMGEGGVEWSGVDWVAVSYHISPPPHFCFGPTYHGGWVGLS